MEEIPLHEPLPQMMEDEKDKMGMTQQSMMHGGDEPDAADNRAGVLSKNDSQLSVAKQPAATDAKASVMSKQPPGTAASKQAV